MNSGTFIQTNKGRAAACAVLVALFGVLLGFTKLGEGWVNRSYDYLYRFTSRSATNVVLVLMDNDALDEKKQVRGKWDRALYPELLDRLVEDDCRLVMFDVLLRWPRETNSDLALAASISRLPNVVLMANQIEAEHQPGVTALRGDSVRPSGPLELFLAAAKTNWGIALFDPDKRDLIVRQHWPFPSPHPNPHYPGFAWTGAILAGAKLDDEPQERWLRYYAPNSWTRLSYHHAPANYFHDKIVFIGNKPATTAFGDEPDEFRTPLTSDSVGGVELLATQFLNLVNHEWLVRANAGIEAFVMILTGLVLGASFCHRRVWTLSLCALGAVVVAWVAGVCLTHFTSYWFPWLVVVGGQVPLAFLLGVVWRQRPATVPMSTIVIHAPTPASRAPAPGTDGPFNPPDYEVVEPPFGKGAYGKVWLARNAVGQWQALKAVYRSKFGEDTSPYEREFRGIEHYKRVSDKHPGLLRIDFVSRMKAEGFFYYAMELGDAATPDWKKEPTLYKPLDLAAMAATFEGGRIPVRDCIRIATKLCEPLHFLHSQNLTHRDIKPRNIIFVDGEPKLADVGLVTDAHRSPLEVTWVGTPEYMPPAPEPPGTPQADIFGLGMVLYVISTGDKPKAFPEISTTLVDRNRNPDFSLLSSILFKACQPNREMRFRTAEEMRAALLEAAAKLSP